MRRLFDSLRGQLVLLIVAALAIAQAVSLFLFVDERGLAVGCGLHLALHFGVPAVRVNGY